MFNFYRNLLARKIIFGSTVGAAIFFMVIGVVYWGAFNTAMEATNNLEFCISCHEMKDNVYQEYIKSSHYKNRSGIRAICSDCHVPNEWQHKVVRKIQATSELLHTLNGTIDTKEKFNEQRLQLAQTVWAVMKETDSRECKNCHHFDAMEPGKQKARSALVHTAAQQRNMTCIDCHKGIAHQLPDDTEVYMGGSDIDHDYYKAQKLECHQCHENMPKPIKEDWGF
jgi:cytochrome c-type protein NapC